MSASAIPSIGKPELEYLAEEHTKSFLRTGGKDDPGFLVWQFASHYLGKKVRFEWLSNGGYILGLSSFMDGTRVPLFCPEENTVRWINLEAETILLSKTLENPFVSVSKSRFTLMHECAHHILHTGYYRQKAALGSGKQVAYSIQRDTSEDTAQPKGKWTNLDRIEWQANYFASALLMPESRIHSVLLESGWQEEYAQRVKDRGSEAVAYNSMKRKMASAFRVSPTTVGIRLDAIGFQRVPDPQLPKADPWAGFTPDPYQRFW